LAIFRPAHRQVEGMSSRLVFNAHHYDRKKAELGGEFGLKREYMKYSEAVR